MAGGKPERETAEVAFLKRRAELSSFQCIGKLLPGAGKWMQRQGLLISLAGTPTRGGGDSLIGNFAPKKKAALRGGSMKDDHD